MLYFGGTFDVWINRVSPGDRSRRRGGGGEVGRGSRYTVAVILQWRDIHRHSTMDGTIYLAA